MTDRPAPEPVSEPAALTLDRLAGLIAAYRWVEHRLFELTGAWALRASPPALQVLLDRVSGEHAWHAELWANRQPLPPHLEPPADPPAAAGALLAALADLGPASDDGGGTEDAVPALAGLARVVLPRLMVTYRTHLRRAVPGTDGPEIRVLRFVLADEVEAWRDAEALVQELAAAPAARAAAGRACTRLEDALAEEHAGPGLVAWPAGPAEGC